MNVMSRLRGAGALAIAGILGVSAPVAAQQGGMKRVDLELVLAVDISQSMDQDEHALQRNGYVEAFRHKDVINALVSGPEGRIAVVYMEWAGDFEPIVTIPWTIIDSDKAAHNFADRLEKEPIFGEQRTSISTALMKATELIEGNDIASHRQVIDVSGDGANNAGPLVEPVRDEVVKRGIVINGLPIMLKAPTSSMFDIAELDRYYAHCVIGGTGSFLVPVRELAEFKLAIRRKLLLEISGLQPPARIVPVQNVQEDGFDCLTGEKLWRGYYFPERGPN